MRTLRESLRRGLESQGDWLRGTGQGPPRGLPLRRPAGLLQEVRKLHPALSHDHHAVQWSHETRGGTPLRELRIPANNCRRDGGQLRVVQTWRKLRLRTLRLEDDIHSTFAEKAVLKSGMLTEVKDGFLELEGTSPRRIPPRHLEQGRVRHKLNYGLHGDISQQGRRYPRPPF